MSGGGGGGSTGTNGYDLMMQREADARDARNRADDLARQEAEKAAARSRFTTGLGSAIGNARSRAERTVRERGLSWDDIGSYLTDAIDNRRTAVPDLANNPGSYFGDDFIDNALSRARDDRRARYSNDAANRFSTGFENNYFSDNMDDSYINDILGTQRRDAEATLDRARRRGNLDDQGFSAGMRRINEMYKVGQSEANSIGGAILQGNRARLRDVGSRAISDAGSYELGRNWSLDPYNNEFDATLNGLNTNLEGQVRSGLEGQNFFDIGDIIQKGGVYQGAQNPSLENADAIAMRAQLRDSNRGLGSGGGTF